MTSVVIVAALALIELSEAGPIPDPIMKSGLSVVVRDFVRMPESGTPYARINFLREQPGGSDRLFANDLNSGLFTIEKSSKQIATYIDFNAVFPELKTSPGLASGHVTFEFHPEFATNGKIYTVHSEFLHTQASGETAAMAPPLGNFTQTSVLIEWTAADPSADSFSGTRREILRVGTPGRIHPVGDLGFNPQAVPSDDDYGNLYVSIGDGQSFNSGQAGNLQRLDSYLGTLLRIHPDLGPSGNSTLSSNGQYRIPNDNPWASDNDSDPDTFGELYAYGFRNPHRMSWDSVTETMFVTDIGQADIEEVNIIHPGANYGWSQREGTFTVGGGTLPPGESGFTYPVAQYDHDEGSAISSGFVYRGEKIPDLQGMFVFGDIGNGRIFYSDAEDLIAADDGDPNTTAAIHELQLIYDGADRDLTEIVSDALGTRVTRADLRLATDASGELYLTTKMDGWIREVLPHLPGDFDFSGEVDGRDFLKWQQGGSPDSLSATDLMAWESNYGTGVSPLGAVTLVPEPSALLLAGMMLAVTMAAADVGVMSRHRSHRRHNTFSRIQCR